MKKNKKIFILSVGRSDFLRQLTILDCLKKEKSIQFKLVLSGDHSIINFKKTKEEIKKKKIIYVNCCPKKYYPHSSSITTNIINCSKKIDLLLRREKPDVFIIFGDRYEMMSGAIACFGKKILIIHIHGGSITEGSFDDNIRHSLTKLSHFHLTPIKEYYKRLIQMGEEKFRIKVVGAPGLDYIKKFSKKIESKEIKNFSKNKYILMCFHSETNRLSGLKKQLDCLVDVVKMSDINFIITYPNSDPGSEFIIKKLKELKKLFPKKILLINNAGKDFYFLLKNCEMLIGNSSSGIVESATFHKITLNIGSRQTGKLIPKNVINCDFDKDFIINFIKKKLVHKKYKDINSFNNPYGDGKSGKKIVNFLKRLDLNNDQNYIKKFVTS